MAIADPLSRLARQQDRVENLDLPVLLEMLLRELPPSIKMAERIRVNAEKDTYVVTRIVQRWRTPANPTPLSLLHSTRRQPGADHSIAKNLQRLVS
jgi:hypothetical protein